jgi:hypothetical protein
MIPLHSALYPLCLTTTIITTPTPLSNTTTDHQCCQVSHLSATGRG